MSSSLIVIRSCISIRSCASPSGHVHLHQVMCISIKSCASPSGHVHRHQVMCISIIIIIFFFISIISIISIIDPNSVSMHGTGSAPNVSHDDRRACAHVDQRTTATRQQQNHPQDDDDDDDDDDDVPPHALNTCPLKYTRLVATRSQQPTHGRLLARNTPIYTIAVK
jgi:hypothetical protein